MSNYQTGGKRKTLENWIAEALNDRDKESQLSMLVLIHKVGMGDQEIHTTKISPGMTRTPKELAEMFWNKAETYSQDLSGAQTFNLLGFYGKAEPEARQPFIVTPQTDTNGLATEGPHAQGALQQGMRLTEAIVQGTYRERSMLLQTSYQIIEKLASMNEKLMVENRDAFEIVRDVMMDRVKLDHESRMKEHEFVRSTAERKKVMAMIPVGVNMLAGREVIPQSTIDTSLIEMLAGAINEENIGDLAKLVPPEMMGIVMSRLVEIQKKKNEEAAEVQRLLGASGEMVKAAE